MLGENGRQSCWILEEQDSVVFRNRLLQRVWKEDGVRVEDFPRIHDSGHPQRDSENDGPADFKDRIIFMSMFNDIVWDAVADLIKELPYDQRAPGKLVALDQMEQEVIIQTPLAEVQANDDRQGNLLQAIQIVLRSRFEFG